MPGSQDATLTELTKYDTPTICNVIEMFEVRPRNVGYMNGRIGCCFPELPPMVGYACTATSGSDAPYEEKIIYEQMAAQFEGFAKMPGPAVVVFQDLDDPPVAATFGDIMCSSYQRFGAIGLITSGAGRDLDQVLALKFPVFSGATMCAHAYTHIKQINVPVRVGGLTIQPGDLLHGDRNGVTTIPVDILPKLPWACQEYVEAEKIVLNYVQQPNCTISGFRQAFNECKKKIHAISVRVRLQK